MRLTGSTLKTLSEVCSLALKCLMATGDPKYSPVLTSVNEPE